ncbi:MAG: RluA family pseudouridine synthase [Polyangiales bacterium]
MVAPIELVVSAEEAGERLDRVLSARSLGFSRSALQGFIAEGRVEVDGRVVRPSARLQAGARVRVRPSEPKPSAAEPQDIPLQILFQDEHLAVLMKPAGLVVHPAPGHWDGTLVNALRFHLEVRAGDPQRPGIVHRLDQDTSGVMVVARTELARERLIAQFKQHDIEREYLAIALGIPASQRIETLHGRHPRDRKRFTSRVSTGKRAVTIVHVLERLHGASLLRCTLETGRTHQIRMHLAELGHPLLADPVYGRQSQDPRLREAARAIARQALHARLLGFTHPQSGERLRFTAEPPEDFARALSLLRDT